MFAIVAGQGIGQITTFQAQQHLARGELVTLLPDWPQPALPVYVVYPPNRHLSAKVRAFVDWAAELFAQNPMLQRA
ncbi:DNA-binding transcriptional activator GcvA [compost metagenome]